MTNKIGKPVQLAPELEIPLGTILSFVRPVLAKAKNPLCLGLSRIHGTCFGALQTLVWGALPQ
jgi:hypothetical protein